MAFDILAVTHVNIDCRDRADFLAVGGDGGGDIPDVLEWLEPEPIRTPKIVSP